MVDEKPAEAPTREEIAVKAFELSCARGCENRYDVKDWLAAETELVRGQEPAGTEPPCDERGTP